MSKIKLYLCLLLLICHIDVRLADDDGDDHTLQAPAKEVTSEEATDKGGDDHTLKAPAKAETTEEASDKGGDDESGGDSGGAGGGKTDTHIDFQKKYDKVKKDKSGQVLKGKSGKIYQVVVETIKEINPVRLLKEFNPEVFLRVNGIDYEKFKIPVNYFSESFWTKLSAKVKMSKEEMSKQLKCDIVQRKEGVWLSLGVLMKFGTEKKVTLGDYLECLGMDLTPYEKKYDEGLIETIRVPIQFIDEVLTEGFDKYIKAIREYVTASGGPMNAALKAYGDSTGTDVVASTRKMIQRMKSYNVTSDWGSKGSSYDKAWAEYKIVLKKQLVMYYNYWFGKGGQYYVLQARIAAKINKMMSSYSKMQKDYVSGGKLKHMIDLAGNSLGPEGRAIVYIVYQPTATMFNQIFGPMMIVPRVMSSDWDHWEKLLALPPVIIQTSGGLFKPVLMVIEPLLRLLRFIVTGEYNKSLTCGLDVAAAYGISIWGGVYKPKKLAAPDKVSKTHHTEDSEEHSPEDSEHKPVANPKGGAKPKKRSKRDAKAGKAPKPSKTGKVSKDSDEKEESPEEASQYTQSDKKMADSYQGGPPPGGYKLGVKNDGKIDLDDEDFISRILLSPDFILKAGGPVYVPFASVLAPTLRTFNLILFGEEEFNKRMAQVPDIIRGVGLIGPLADVVQAMLPYIKTTYLIYHGKLTGSDMIIQTPSLVKHATSGVLYGVYKHPEKLIHAMLSFLDGHGGLLAMLRLQSRYDVPTTDPGAMEDAKKEFGEDGNFVVKSLGEFFGGWFLTYIQAIGPIGSLIGTWFNGVLGNIIAPVKFLDTGIDLKHQPLKTVIEAFEDLPRMLKSAEDKRTFLSALLGGQDPDVLNEIGINAEKLTQNGIDPGLLLCGGKKLLNKEAQSKLQGGGESIGLNGQLMGKVGLQVQQVINSGLLDANPQKLIDAGIDVNIILSRVMRGSVEDDALLMNAGISIKIMVKAGICPATFLAGGISAVPQSELQAAGVSKGELNDESLKKLGLNPIKLHSKGVDAKKLAKDGIEGFAKQQAILGINIQTLMFSVYHGLDHKRMLKAGIDIHKMLRAGIDPKVLLVGGLREALKGDLSEQSLAKVGIDSKQILKMGININLLADVGASVVNPMNLNKLAIDPMNVVVGCLSRSGLDMLTGGTQDATSVSFGFVASILKIVHNGYRMIPKIRDLPYGKNIIGPDGQWVGAAGFFMYKIIGIDNHGGLLGFLRKLFAGKFTKAEILEMINPIRLAKEAANPKARPVVARRRKENRKSVDDYLKKSVQMRVGASRNGPQKGKSNIFGRAGLSGGSTESDDIYDERTTEPSPGGSTEDGGDKESDKEKE